MMKLLRQRSNQTATSHRGVSHECALGNKSFEDLRYRIHKQLLFTERRENAEFHCTHVPSDET